VRDGNVSSHAETAAPRVAGPSRLAPAGRAPGEYPRRGPDHCIDLSAGGRRSVSLFRFRPGHELLRLDLGPAIVRRQSTTRTHFQTAEPVAADRADRSRQASPALEPATGRAARPRAGTRTSQPRHLGRGPQQVAHLLAVDKSGQPFQPFACAMHRARGAASQLRKSCDDHCQVVSDLPAVLRRLGDWAEESALPMLPSACFEAGRKTLTQSSWTAPPDCSRKWMSGQADALTVAKDRGRFAHPTPFPTALRESLSAGRPPSLLDFYLSWMSAVFLCPAFPQDFGSGLPFSSLFFRSACRCVQTDPPNTRLGCAKLRKRRG
jgi:hypothetical protein